ncbi:MAG: hypothetical protein ACYC1E_14855 [Propionibacteriaceae bacterium]
MTNIAEWFTGRSPDWFTGSPEVTVDREEILVVGRLRVPDSDSAGSDSAAEGRIARWREETRRDRMKIADEAEERFGRKVARSTGRSA